VINDLMITGAFDWLKIDVDEDEHAIEMQLPFIAHMMQGYATLYLISSL
jgi:predicted class III extradiol MEMO1 family dioxygenase